ncbi:unnamed protein product, partial [Oppiella nova]
MWTNYGLRSLSKTSFYYNKYNSEHEEPYWRGPIWININYLVLRGLRHYADIPGPNQSKAALIYKELRNNIIENMFTEYERTGFVWEQYNDMTGKGQDSHPSSGWSGVVVLIMSDVSISRITGNSTDVNIPFDHHFHTEPILPFNTWGSFRAFQYFGLKTSSPDSPLIGLVWFNNSANNVSALHVRHWCDLNDGLTYGWKYHNFDDFGFQTIKDNDYNFNTSFIKYAADNWKALVSVNQKNAKPIISNNNSISLIIYLSIQRDKDVIHINGYNSSSIQITGFNEFIGNFSLNITSQGDPLLYSGQLDSNSSVVDVIKEIKSNLTPIIINGTQIYGLKTQKVPSRSQLIAYQVVFREQTKLMIEFNVKKQLKEKLSNVGDYDNDMKERIRLFGQEFDTKFGLKGKGFNEKQITFAQSVLSEMLGSIGYFNGNLSVDSPGMTSPKTYGPLEMLSAVPSRPVFPRPFLWDEGFHNLLIQRWNSSLTLKIMN